MDDRPAVDALRSRVPGTWHPVDRARNSDLHVIDYLSFPRSGAHRRPALPVERRAARAARMPAAFYDLVSHHLLPEERFGPRGDRSRIAYRPGPSRPRVRLDDRLPGGRAAAEGLFPPDCPAAATGLGELRV
jgi:hypothetical protein